MYVLAHDWTCFFFVFFLRVTLATCTIWCQLTFRSLGDRLAPPQFLPKRSHPIYLVVSCSLIIRVHIFLSWRSDGFLLSHTVLNVAVPPGAAAAAVMSSSKTVLRPATGAGAGPGQPAVQHIIHQAIQVHKELWTLCRTQRRQFYSNVLVSAVPTGCNNFYGCASNCGGSYFSNENSVSRHQSDCHALWGGSWVSSSMSGTKFSSDLCYTSDEAGTFPVWLKFYLLCTFLLWSTICRNITLV